MIEELVDRSSWGVIVAKASEGDISMLFLVLAVIAAGIGVYFLWVQNWLGAVVCVFVAILIVVFLL